MSVTISPFASTTPLSRRVSSIPKLAAAGFPDRIELRRSPSASGRMELLLPEPKNRRAQLQQAYFPSPRLPLATWYEPRQTGHGHSHAVPFVDVDEFAVALSSLSKALGKLLLIVGGAISIWGATAAYGELREAIEELGELDQELKALRDAPLPEVERASELLQAAHTQRAVAMQRVRARLRAVIAKVVVQVPATVGAMSMGLSVLLGQELLGALVPLGAALPAVLMQVAVPCIALMGVATATAQLVEAVCGHRRRAALRRVAGDGQATQGERQAAAHVLSHEMRLLGWRLGGCAAGLALAAGVVASFVAGPIGLALLLPGAIALPVCNGIVGTNSARPRLPQLPEEPAQRAEALRDVANAQLFAGTRQDVAANLNGAVAEVRACNAAVTGYYSRWALVRGWTHLRHGSAKLPADAALRNLVGDLWQARSDYAQQNAGENTQALQETLAESRRNLQQLDVAGDPMGAARALMRVLAMEGAFEPFVLRLQRIPEVWAPLKLSGDADVSTRDVLQVIYRHVAREARAAVVQKMCEQALRALVPTVLAIASTRHLTSQSQFATWVARAA